MLTVLRIDRWDPRREGRVTAAALRRKMRSRGYQVCTRAWPAGTIVPPRTDLREHIDAVVDGMVPITVDDESAIVIAGDMVFVPRGAVRPVEVVGAGTAHCLDAVGRP